MTDRRICGGSGDVVTPSEPKWGDCGEKGCPVTRKHWHCVSCGEPCEVGEQECLGCWGDDESIREWEEAER